MSRAEALVRVSGIKLSADFWRGWLRLDNSQQEMLARAMLAATNQPMDRRPR